MKQKINTKKGFTLVELVVIVTLLIVVAGIFSVNLIKTLNNQKEETNKEVTAQIVSAANAYVSMNPEAVEKLYVSAGYIDIPIGILRDNGFLSEEITDAETGENVKDEELVRVQLGILDHLDYIYPANGDEEIDAWSLRADPIVLSVDKTGENWCTDNAFYGLIRKMSDMSTTDSKLYLQYTGTDERESKVYTEDNYFAKDGINLQATCNVDVTKPGTYNIKYTYNDPNLKIQKSATRVVYVRGSDSDVASFTASIKTTPLIAGYTRRDDVLIDIVETTKYGDKIPHSFKISELEENGYKIDNFDISRVHTGKARVTRTRQNSDGTMPKPTYRDIDYTVYKQNYRLTFDYNDGSNTKKTVDINYGDTITFPNPAPTYSGYTLKGWSLKSSNGTLISNNSKYTFMEDKTLYANWDANEYTVTFNYNGGSGSSSSKPVKFGASYGTLPTPNSRTGYNFDGWYTASSGGSQITNSSVVNISSNHTLYARWTPLKYTVSFYIDGSKYLSTTSDYMGQYYMPTPSKTGYKFDGWYTTTSKTTKVGSGSYRTLSTTDNVNLYGYWQQSTVKVNFNANGGTITSGSSSRTLNAGSTLGTLPTAENGCSQFAGWYTSSSGGSKISTSTTVNSNATYYAHWTSTNNFKISFNPNGGKVTPSFICMSKSISYPYDMYPSLPVPYRSGYYFSGMWLTPGSTEWGISEGAGLYSKTDHTLTAHWYSYQQTIGNRWYSSTCNTYMACEEACKVTKSYSDGSKSISTCRVNSYGGGCSGYQTPPSSCSAYWD